MDKFLLYLRKLVVFLGSIVTIVVFCLDVRNGFIFWGYLGGVVSIVAFPATILASPLVWGFGLWRLGARLDYLRAHGTCGCSV